MGKDNLESTPQPNRSKVFGLCHGSNPHGDLVWVKGLQKNAFGKYSIEPFLRFKCQRAFKNKICHISGVYWPILFKICMQVAKRSRLMVCYMFLAIKGQTKAVAVFKGINGVY